jgi:AraC-like DNA-binding protein
MRADGKRQYPGKSAERRREESSNNVKHRDLFRYFPISEKNLQWGAYMTGIGYERRVPGDPYPGPGHPSPYDFDWTRGRELPEYQFVYTSDGRGVFESRKTGRIAVGKGDLIVLFPGVWHRYRPEPDVGWESYWVSMQGISLYHLVERGVITPEKAVIHTGANKAVIGVYRWLMRSAARKVSGPSFVWGLRSLEILARALETGKVRAELSGPAEVPPPWHGIEDPLVANALRIIWHQSHKPLQVSDISQALLCSRRTLERRFMASRRRSLNEEIHYCRLMRAAQMLENTTLPVKEIAYSLGFSSPERFAKVFAREFGATPIAHRKSTCRDNS